MSQFFSSRPVQIASALLLLQAGLLYSSIREEIVPVSRPLAQMPISLGTWRFVSENVMDKETAAVLQADDNVNRTFNNGTTEANLFVAAFRSQRTGKAPHSPKNCLPGSGWEPLNDRIVEIDGGIGTPIEVNRYVVAYGENRSLVLYWYQSRDRAVASEYKAKFWVVADAIRYNRTDTALIRVVIPIRNKDEAAAQKQAEDFVKSFYPTVLRYLPA
jgi:EpsI family protein